MTRLKQVLEAFEQSTCPLTAPRLAKQLAISEEMVEEMITFWVRKGRLRKIETAPACTHCGSASTCATLVNLPAVYEITPGSSDAAGF